ncbi:sensor histidine kinase [Altibacter sp. HG106]|uniref:sensor histidine kinase n=1 Tax=Altibacter sp. HG106 TaxID=3023937 RepID=UPI0023507BD9|nr:HAMP domain-containing sensor histidine kinase [Altibacter sp. HG106]MDC7995233.1 HAMP domain-containing sensor histidine kinase [Altibacter sp. HG106]
MYSKTAFIRWFFIFASLCIISLILWNTYAFFNQLKDNERNKMKIWAFAQEELQKSLVDEASLDNTSEMVLPILQSNTTTPMILYSHKEDLYDSRNLDEQGVSEERLRAFREKMAQQFSREYQPIEIRFRDDLLQTIYYGNSPIINKLKYYPAALIVIILLFFLAIYLFYRTSKSSEQNQLWAGMAKETAHQIGTPLSSLVGWNELLKAEQVNPEYTMEIEKDIDRLQTITERFSKIGSVPTLTRRDIVAETASAYSYLKNRSSKLIEFSLKVPDHPVPVDLNQQLYAWTIENLVKNGIDAMRGKGKITIEILPKGKNVHVQISDTGKGIPRRNQKRVFKPGFTTKKRGWGLGLSLAKRIIREYHNGKIHVLKSTKGVGTTMEIILKQQANT